MRRYTLKDALALAPMELCSLPRVDEERSWWRYGWAMGFLERSLEDALAGMRDKGSRDAAAIGYSQGFAARARAEARRIGV